MIVMCDHPGCNVVKPISKIAHKDRRADLLAVVREDGTITVYQGDPKANDAQLIAYGECIEEARARFYFPKLFTGSRRYYVN